MAAAHAKIVEHDQQCPRNPLVSRIAYLEQLASDRLEQMAAAEARIAELETEIAQWRDMGIRAVTGGRGVEGGDLIPNQIWPNGWQQDIAMVAYLIHCHEVRIAELETALVPFASWDGVHNHPFNSLTPDSYNTRVIVKIGDLRRASALVNKEER